jgi:hypothetical protein
LCVSVIGSDFHGSRIPDYEEEEKYSDEEYEAEKQETVMEDEPQEYFEQVQSMCESQLMYRQLAYHNLLKTVLSYHNISMSNLLPPPPHRLSLLLPMLLPPPSMLLQKRLQ